MTGEHRRDRREANEEDTRLCGTSLHWDRSNGSRFSNRIILRRKSQDNKNDLVNSKPQYIKEEKRVLTWAMVLELQEPVSPLGASSTGDAETKKPGLGKEQEAQRPGVPQKSQNDLSENDPVLPSF